MTSYTDKEMDLILGQEYSIRVEKIISAGAIVRVLDDNGGYTKLLHISNISPQFVKNIDDFISIGDTYIAKGVIGKSGSVELSLKHLNLKPRFKTSPRESKFEEKCFDFEDFGKDDFEDENHSFKKFNSKSNKHAKSINSRTDSSSLRKSRRDRAAEKSDRRNRILENKYN